MGTAPPGTTYNTEGIGTPMIAGAGDYGETYPVAKKWTTAPTRIAEKGDLIVCVRATIGDLNWADQTYCLGRGVAGLRPRENKLDIKYLAYFIQANKNTLTALGTGSTFLAIRKADLEDLAIPIPFPDDPKRSLTEQRRIAGIMDQADAIRRQRRAALDELNTLIPAIFQDMFGDPVNNPKGWPIDSLSRLANNEDGKRVPVKSSDRADMQGEYPYYGASGVIDYVDDYLFDGPSLLIGEDGANLLARVTPIAFIAKGKYWVNNHAHVLRENGRACLKYLEVAINSRDIANFVTGSAQPKLNQKNLNRIPIQSPPKPLQQQFVQRADEIERLAVDMQQLLDESNNLFHSLVQRAFRGEL